MKTFMVKGKPFIAIAGEVHNSNSSDADYMECVWDKAQEQGLNTLLLPATWELIEPHEGEFHFDLIDKLIMQARARNCHIIFLWFGTWKNAQCMYAPEWVKKDIARFPRAEVEKGKNKTRLMKFHGMAYTSLSYLGEETCKADAKAFREFMKHLKEVDEGQQTVIAVQVENETGLQGADREHSDLADEIFASEVPSDFVKYMKSHTDTMEPEIRDAVLNGKDSGTWEEVFTEAAGEIFSAFHIASYINKVATAGKEVYNLPMTVNCWLDKGEEPGQYPTGGPVAKVMEVWKYKADAIDVFAPDIYVPNFTEICEKYTKLDNPLCIPETATHSHCAPRLIYALGHHHAICYAPFGFEDMGNEFDAVQSYLFGVDVSDPLLTQPQSVPEYYWCATTLNSMMDKLTEAYGTNRLQAVLSENVNMDPWDISQGLAAMPQNNPKDDTMIFGDYGFKIVMNMPLIPRKDGVCMILQESEDTFYVLAHACMVNIFSTNEEKPNYDIIAMDEGHFENSNWICGRRFNGDESSQMNFKEYTLFRIKLFAYK
jgi:hypothetical protein